MKTVQIPVPCKYKDVKYPAYTKFQIEDSDLNMVKESGGWVIIEQTEKKQTKKESRKIEEEN